MIIPDLSYCRQSNFFHTEEKWHPAKNQTNRFLYNFVGCPRNVEKEEFMEKKLKEKFTGSEHYQSDSLKLRAKLVAKAKKVIEETPGLYIFSNMTLNGYEVEYYCSFSTFYFRKEVASLLPRELADRYVQTTEKGVRLLKKRCLKKILKQLDISFFNYMDESNHQFLLIDPGVLNIKKPMKTKKIKLHNQKDPELSVEKVREKFPNAYMPWGSEEDSDLEREFLAGKNVRELSEIFRRQESAIEARLKKLDLMD
jgi:hypothetical protein